MVQSAIGAHDGCRISIHRLTISQVFWLLPVFLLFNLGMGATTMPKMNVLTSLLCRQILNANPALMQHEPRHEGSMMPSMEDMAKNHTASTVIIGEHNPQCSIDKVESATSILMLYGNLIAGIIGAMTAPFWGKLSDSYGRIKPLALTSTIILASETIFVLIAKFPNSLHINWIYLAYMLEGLRYIETKPANPHLDAYIWTVAPSSSSWRSLHHMQLTVQLTAAGMSLLAGFMAACSLASPRGQCLEDSLA